MFDGSLDDIPDEYRLTGGGEELENNGKIVVVVVEPGKEPRIEEIDSGLESLQGMVGGYIQAIYAIDFEQNTITIRHTVTSCDLDGKRVLVASDTTKTKSSMRTLPLVPFMRERLLALKEEQQENRRLCGRSYIKDYLEYVCVNEIGDLIKPHYVTESFPKLLKAKGMRQIRYHDLRHSCASLLLANDVPMKQIQEWLGHSDISTTANIYSHLDYKSKLTSANVMDNVLTLPETEAVGWRT